VYEDVSLAAYKTRFTRTRTFIAPCRARGARKPGVTPFSLVLAWRKRYLAVILLDRVYERELSKVPMVSVPQVASERIGKSRYECASIATRLACSFDRSQSPARRNLRKPLPNNRDLKIVHCILRYCTFVLFRRQ